MLFQTNQDADQHSLLDSFWKHSRMKSKNYEEAGQDIGKAAQKCNEEEAKPKKNAE